MLTRYRFYPDSFGSGRIFENPHGEYVKYEDVKALEAEVERLSSNLNKIARIIWDVDSRCMAADGPVTPTLQEMTQEEISKIYELAGGNEAALKGEPKDDFKDVMKGRPMTLKGPR